MLNSRYSITCDERSIVRVCPPRSIMSYVYETTMFTYHSFIAAARHWLWRCHSICSPLDGGLISYLLGTSPLHGHSRHPTIRRSSILRPHAARHIPRCSGWLSLLYLRGEDGLGSSLATSFTDIQPRGDGLGSPLGRPTRLHDASSCSAVVHLYSLCPSFDDRIYSFIIWYLSDIQSYLMLISSSKPSHDVLSFFIISTYLQSPYH